MKKIICVLLATVLLFATAMPALAATNETVTPYYTNATSAKASLDISSDGWATVIVSCSGKPGTQSISVTYYVEKLYGSNTWVRVNTGTTNNEWTVTTTGRLLSDTQTVKLYVPGKHRLTAVFVVTLSSSETITLTDECTF